MSLLMDALKQQNNAVAETTAAPTGPARGWQYLAIVLLVLCGLGLGFALAFWFTHKPVAEPVPVVVAAPTTPVATPALPPANPGLILSDLTAVPTSEEQEAQLVISAEREESQGQSLDEQVAVLEQFDEGIPMQEADPDAPVAELAAQQPELSADEVPQELKDKFQYALEAAKGERRPAKITEHAAPARDISTLDDSLQRQIAPLRFEAHVYASEPKQRWVKVNGKDLQEGQWITADIQLKEITPQYVLMQTGRQLFSMEALSEWSYRLKTRP
jgi:general secretion pathway protein B